MTNLMTHQITRKKHVGSKVPEGLHSNKWNPADPLDPCAPGQTSLAEAQLRRPGEPQVSGSKRVVVTDGSRFTLIEMEPTGAPGMVGAGFRHLPKTLGFTLGGLSMRCRRNVQLFVPCMVLLGES